MHTATLLESVVVRTSRFVIFVYENAIRVEGLGLNKPKHLAPTNHTDVLPMHLSIICLSLRIWLLCHGEFTALKQQYSSRDE
eukprot:scaffold36180_cov19-Prasinocladus_malaysianus.AAC.1